MADNAKESADSGPEQTADPLKVPSNDRSLSKAAPRLRRPRLKKQSKDLLPQTTASLVKVDVSANRVEITQGARVFGTNDSDSIRALMQQVLNATPNAKGDLEPLKAALATVDGIAPRNALEGLLAVQMIGVHNLAMECLRRALLKEQTREAIDANVHRAVRLLRTFTSQMEALNRNRGKVGQQMVVGNVNINDGGQAIVGSVEHHSTEKAPAENETNDR